MRQAGSALYLVMLAVVVISVGSLVILQQASARHRLRVADRTELAEDTLLADAELVTGRWLVEHGRDLSTPLEDPYRARRIIDTTATWQELPIRLTVDVWDACGGLPCDLADRDAVAKRLPDDIHLDTSLPLPVWWESAITTKRPRFPLDPADARTANSPPAVALVLGTWAARRVNWRTASWDLVADCLSRAGRSQDEPVLRQARQTGVVPPGDGPSQVWPADVEPVLVGETDRWCVRIRFDGPRYRRSRFVVMVAGGSGTRVLVRHAES
jgi:hypothetical protein